MTGYYVFTPFKHTFIIWNVFRQQNTQTWIHCQAGLNQVPKCLANIHFGSVYISSQPSNAHQASTPRFGEIFSKWRELERVQLSPAQGPTVMLHHSSVQSTLYTPGLIGGTLMLVDIGKFYLNLLAPVGGTTLDLILICPDRENCLFSKHFSSLSLE